MTVPGGRAPPSVPGALRESGGGADLARAPLVVFSLLPVRPRGSLPAARGRSVTRKGGAKAVQRQRGFWTGSLQPGLRQKVGAPGERLGWEETLRAVLGDDQVLRARLLWDIQGIPPRPWAPSEIRGTLRGIEYLAWAFHRFPIGIQPRSQQD